MEFNELITPYSYDKSVTMKLQEKASDHWWEDQRNTVVEICDSEDVSTV